MIDEQSSASEHDCASDRSAIGAGCMPHLYRWLEIPGEALVLFTGGGSPGAVKTYPNSADKPP